MNGFIHKQVELLTGFPMHLTASYFELQNSSYGINSAKGKNATLSVALFARKRAMHQENRTHALASPGSG